VWHNSDAIRYALLKCLTSLGSIPPLLCHSMYVQLCRRSIRLAYMINFLTLMLSNDELLSNGTPVSSLQIEMFSFVFMQWQESHRKELKRVAKFFFWHGWQKIHHTHISSSCCSPNIIRVIKSRMSDNILYVVSDSDIPGRLLQWVVSPLLWTGTITDSFYRCGSSFLFYIEQICL
jgi:hypothetical protein